MSKIGQRPIKIEEGVTLTVSGTKVIATYKDNTLELQIPEKIKLKIEDNVINIERIGNDKEARSWHGLFARLLNNIIIGVKTGFVKNLDFTGTGYRAALNNNVLNLSMGYSHEINLPVPEGLTVKVVKNSIEIAGIKKDEVGQFAAIIRSVRPPEVYKGKGIKYREEFIKRKAGKTASSK
ncbi:MAG: 50S ribosomal protein L6 [bacterium]